jgi:polygalacturonase
MGTESRGGFVDIVISNCTVFSPMHSKAINGTQPGEAGIALEIVDGGRLENVSVTDIKINGVLMPIFLRLGDRGRPYATGPRPAVGSFRNVTLKNITAENASPLGCVIAGLPDHPIENVLLENITLGFEGGGDRLEYEHKAFQPRNSSRGPEGGDDPTNTKRRISEQASTYPGYKMFGILPAYGFYCRHVNGLRFDNVKLRTAAADKRHALMFDDAEAVSISGLDVAGWPGSAALLCFVQTRGATISGVAVQAPADLLLQLEGAGTKNIVLEKSDVQDVKKISSAAAGVPADAFVQKP